MIKVKKIVATEYICVKCIQLPLIYFIEIFQFYSGLD